MTPKQFIKYTKKLDKNGLAICDGTTTDFHSTMDVVYTILLIIFIMSGTLFGGRILRIIQTIRERWKKSKTEIE